MTRKGAQRQLLELLLELDFDTKYYAFVDSLPPPDKRKPVTAEELLGTLDELPFPLKFHRRERFYSFRGRKKPELGFNLAFTSVGAEFILVMEVGTGHIGGTFAGLAVDLKRLRMGDPNFEPDCYPDLPFGSPLELRAAIDFGHSLYLSMESRILTMNWE